jgi:Zn-dependent protease
LVHAAQLEQLASGAKMFEEHGELQKARETWLKALQLVPPQATQADWIRDKVKKLELAAAAAPPEKRHEWAKKLGPLAPIAILLAKSKFLLSLFKLKFLFSLFAFVAVYWALYGPKFGAGFAVLILVHEMGHYIDIKRRGLPADMPMFLPGLGAYVRWASMGVSAATHAAVSLAGPLAGLLGAAACAFIWWRTGNRLWAALAQASAFLNVMNLIPVWILDGSKAIQALSKIERVVVLTASLLLFLVLKESAFIFVAAGVTYRLFTKDMAPQPSPATTAYFVGVLAALGVVMWLMPVQGLAGR